MKPALQQEENLRKYLRKVLLYRETYEEVYDHILVSLEKKSQENSFQEAVNKIINDDFGGDKGLVEMEKKCYESVKDEANSQQWNYFKSNFEYPSLAYTLIWFLIIYFSMLKIPFTPFIITFLVAILIVVPKMIRLARYFYIGYFTLDTKSSIKDKIMAKISGRSFLLLNPGIMIIWVWTLGKNKSLNFNSYIFDHAFLISVLTTLFFLYILSFIKLSREDFKVYTSIKPIR